MSPVREDLRCTATARTGERCGQYAISGARVCRFHGGKIPAVRAAAARRVATEKATRQVAADVAAVIAHEGLTPVGNPLDALGRLASEVLTMKDALAARVNALTDMRYSAAGAGTEQLRAEVALLERAQDRCAKILDLLVRSGFEERRIERLERTDAVLEAFMRRVGLAGDQHAEEVLLDLLGQEDDRSLRQVGEKRNVRLSEETASKMGQIVDATFDAVGLSKEQRAVLPEVWPVAVRAAVAGESFVSPVPVPGAPRPDASRVAEVLAWLVPSFGLPSGDARVQTRVTSAARSLASGDPLPEVAVPSGEWWEMVRALADAQLRVAVAALPSAPAPPPDLPDGLDGARRVLEGVVVAAGRGSGPSFRRRPLLDGA